MRPGQGLWARERSARRARCCLLPAFLAIAAVSAPSLRGSDRIAPPALTISPGGSPVEKEIPPGASLRLTISVPPGAAVILDITEIQQTSNVIWTAATGRAHTPRTNLAGKNAQIRLTLPGDPTPQSFAIAGVSKRKAAVVRIAVSAARPEDARDKIAEPAASICCRGECRPRSRHTRRSCNLRESAPPTS
jgi:hypothetical protein